MLFLKVGIHPDFVQDSVLEFPKGFLQNLSRIYHHQHLGLDFGYLFAQDWSFGQGFDWKFELDYSLKLEHAINFVS